MTRVPAAGVPMAGYYQFVFGNSATSDITAKYSIDGSNWTNDSEPGWPPSPSNQGSVLSVQQNDEIFVWLSGPSGWSIGGALQVIIARATSVASGQIYSPFNSSVVWMNPAGSMDGTTWKGRRQDYTSMISRAGWPVFGAR